MVTGEGGGAERIAVNPRTAMRPDTQGVRAALLANVGAPASS